MARAPEIEDVETRALGPFETTADDALGRQKMIDHVENEERAHPVIGEALPHLRGEEKAEAFRMAEDVAG